MQKVLEQLNSVPEVIGSLVCTAGGDPLVYLFPAIFDQSCVRNACQAIGGSRLWQGQLLSSTGLLDLRYSEGRIICRTLNDSILFVLCTKNVNLQLLNISLNVAKKRLEELMPEPRPSSPSPVQIHEAVPPPAPAASAVPAPMTSKQQPNMLTVDELDSSSEAGRGFQELGMAALTANTAQSLANLFHVGGVKKLRLTKVATGATGLFGIMIVNEDSGRYDGKIIISRQVEKKLQAGKGDVLQADLP